MPADLAIPVSRGLSRDTFQALSKNDVKISVDGIDGQYAGYVTVHGRLIVSTAHIFNSAEAAVRMMEDLVGTAKRVEAEIVAPLTRRLCEQYEAKPRKQRLDNWLRAKLGCTGVEAGIQAALWRRYRGKAQ